MVISNTSNKIEKENKGVGKMNYKRFIACDKCTDSEGNIFKFVVIDTKKLGDKLID